MEFWKTGSKRARSKLGHQIYAEDIHELWEDKGIDDYFRNRYRKEIEEMFNWEYIDAEMEPVENDYEVYMSTFVTSHLNLAPSGKYFTFWACSNMEMREIVKDTIFFETLDDILREKGYWLENGEGDALDLFFCKAIN